MSDWHGSDGDFTIIMPTLNEVQNIVPLLDALSKIYPSARMLVVDDSSVDGTPEKVETYAEKSQRVSLIKRKPSDRGLTASIMDGIFLTATPYFVVLDADFQHPPEAVSRIMEGVLDGNDLVIGVRKDKSGLQFARKISSWSAHKMASAYLRARRQPWSRDNMSGFFGGKTDLCRRIIVEDELRFQRHGFKALFDLLKFAPKDTKIMEVEYDFGERKEGTSKLTSKVVISIMRQCGLGGKALAALTTFFLLTMLGRFVAALLLGLLSTLLFLGLTGEVWSNMIIFPIVISFLLAVGYVVIANEFLSGRRRTVGITRGLQIVATSFSGYLLNMGLFYIVATEMPSFQILPTFLGFGIAVGWDTIGSSIPND
jgi:dolichol-phosphate mannosyltransferase